jgi:thymidylate kinase
MFIVIESIDGGGKGFQRIEISDRLDKAGYKVKGVEFPVHNAFYETVVHPALQGETKMNKASWVVSYLLDKTLYADNILPFLGKSGKAKKEIFVADGYFTTTIAYQSFLMEQVPLKKLIQYGKDFEIPVPDLTIFLDVKPEVAIARKNKEEGHDEGPDMFEKSIEKQKKLQKIFRKMVKDQVYCKWEMVDGNGSPEEVTSAILEVLKKHGIK